MAEATVDGGRVSDGFPTSAIVSTVALGIGFGCINPLQPMLLAAMADAGRLTIPEMGRVATAEMIGMAIATTIAALWLKPVRLRRLGAMAVSVAMLANASTAFAEGAGILACRFVNGAMAGVALWILVGLVSRVAAPARVFAIYVTVQATVSLVLSGLLSAIVLPRLGALGGYGMIGLVDLVLLLFFVPRLASRYEEGESGVRGMPPVLGLVALISVGAMMAGVMGFWVYVIPVLRSLGHDENAIHLALSAAIGCQIAGGFFAAVVAGRLPPFAACMGGAAIAAASVVLVMLVPTDFAMFLGLGLFAACWMAVPAFQMPLLIAVDPSLRSALLIGSAQLTGLAIGPALSAAMVPGLGIGAAAGVSVGLMLLSIALLPIPLIGCRRALRAA